MITRPVEVRKRALLLIIPILIFGLVTSSVLIGIQPYDASHSLASFYITAVILGACYVAIHFTEKAVFPASMITIVITTVTVLARVWEVNFGDFREESGLQSLLIAVYCYVPVLFLFGFILLSRQMALLYVLSVWLYVSLVVLISNFNTFTQPAWPEGLDHLISVVWMSYPMFIALTHRALPYSQVVSTAHGEVAEVREALTDMEQLVLVDKLTGIYNRRFLSNFWEKFADPKSYTPHYLSLFIVDIDHFKQYNDNAGHVEGDACLKKISAALKSFADDFNGHAIRYGGEEFLVIVPSEVELDPLVLAEQIRYSVQDLKLPHPAKNINFISVSVGATSGNSNSEQSESNWMRAADTALYESKNNGRDCSTVKNLVGN